MPKIIEKSLKEIIANSIAEGLSTREISKKYSVSIGFVTKIRKAFQISTTINKGGRPNKLSPKSTRLARRLIMTGAVENAVEANKCLRDEYQINVSNDTVRRCLKSIGMTAKTKIRKPLLTPVHRLKRLEFAKDHINWSAEQWQQVIWSDETKINRIGSDGRVWSWYDKKVGPSEKNFQQTVKFGGGSLMLWGCFKADKVGILHRINGIMKAPDYIDILKQSLLPSLHIFCSEPCCSVFMHDNDPKHTAKITTKWLKENGISILEWPPQSPDLNPI